MKGSPWYLARIDATPLAACPASGQVVITSRAQCNEHRDTPSVIRPPAGDHGDGSTPGCRCGACRPPPYTTPPKARLGCLGRPDGTTSRPSSKTTKVRKLTLQDSQYSCDELRCSFFGAVTEQVGLLD